MKKDKIPDRIVARHTYSKDLTGNVKSIRSRMIDKRIREIKKEMKEMAGR